MTLFDCTKAVRYKPGGSACQKSGCGHFFEEGGSRLRAAQIRLVALLPDGEFVRKFLAKARKTRPGGKAAGYDYSQRACGPSDTSRGF